MKLMANSSYMFALMIVLNFISFARLLAEGASNKSNLQNKLYSKFNSKEKANKLQITSFYPKSELIEVPDSYAENYPKENKITNKRKNEVSDKKGIITITNSTKPEMNYNNSTLNVLSDSLNIVLNNKHKEYKALEKLSLNFKKRFSDKDLDFEHLKEKFDLLDKAQLELKSNGNLNANSADAKKDYQLNIYNNFLITNSTITQMLDTFLSSKKTLPQSIFYFKDKIINLF